MSEAGCSQAWLPTPNGGKAVTAAQPQKGLHRKPGETRPNGTATESTRENVLRSERSAPNKTKDRTAVSTRHRVLLPRAALEQTQAGSSQTAGGSAVGFCGKQQPKAETRTLGNKSTNHAAEISRHYHGCYTTK